MTNVNWPALGLSAETWTKVGPAGIVIASLFTNYNLHIRYFNTRKFKKVTEFIE